MLIRRCHINLFDSSFRLTSEKRPRLRFTGPLRWWPVDFSHKEAVTTLQSNAENVSVSWRHHATSHRWAPSLMIDSLHLCFHYHDYHTFLCLCVWNSCILSFYWYGYREAVFNPRPLRPKGYCRHLMRLSVRLSVCSHHPCWHNNSIYPINPPNLLGGFNMALSWMVF